MKTSPRLFVISGPSGAGKGTLVAAARQIRPDLDLTVSATTRPPRPGEVDGVSYHFLSDEEFDRRVAAGDFLEWADVHGHRYGTLICEVDKRIAQGRSVILEIDYQGAFNVRRTYPSAVLVFVEPPSMEELEARLRSRGTEDDDQVRLRLANAAHEMSVADQFDARLVNDDVEHATDQLLALFSRFEMDGGSIKDVSD